LQSIEYRKVHDVIALTKPKITLMAVMVAAAGLLHAPGHPSMATWPALASLLGIAFLVSGSSAFNMYLERFSDKKMTRTKDRPLPAGRLGASWALAVGGVCVSGAALLLFFKSNMLTLALGLLSWVLYVWCYTPLKQKSWVSLLVGSLPGAMPVMLGYLSWSGAIDSKAIALFFWAFLWQIPHFLAISLFREDEYTKAGCPVLSAICGVTLTKKVLLLTSWLLVFSTFGLYASGIVSIELLGVSLLLGAWFLYTCHHGVHDENTHQWAKRAFKASLLYQSALFVVLIYAALV
jgi:protoheme IX farnesyltransferase